MKKENVLTVNNLSFAYQSTKVLDNMDFSIQHGDYIGLVGPNGSGKTTLVKILTGVWAPDTGKVVLNCSHYSYLQQKTSLTDSRFPASVFEIVRTGLLAGKKYPRFFTKDDNRRTDKIISELSLDPLAKRAIGQLSGGQLQKVLLARALVSDPEILFLDEPTAALDPESRGNFYAMMKKLNKEKGTTIVLVTHDIGSIGQYADKILYIDRSLIFYGSFDDFCSSQKMTEYFGSASQHLFCQRHDHGDFHV